MITTKEYKDIDSGVYASMRYWAEEEKGSCWKAENIDLTASVEPGGIP